ncbi:MAG TPA: TonB-dependent receptor [Saprospiraceae bacterium]|nr:TonB-dependent receptor [Saprospiraceae bacterium]
MKRRASIYRWIINNFWEIEIATSILKKGARIVVLFLLLSLLPDKMMSQNETSPSALKKLTVEELMNIEVTIVSKTPEKLTEVASAIQVITGEDIRRSSSTRLPEALRLASNLQVAQPNAHDWSITARGFNGAHLSNYSLANKFLVMIDGRSVYEPLLGGVFWDIQNVLLEDVDKIEVVSGPGGTQWGANAVNGIINIKSKSAKETQGIYASALAGSLIQDHIAARIGSQIDSVFYFRVYAQRWDHNETNLLNGKPARDSWAMNQAGFRTDYYPSSDNSFTLQGDLFNGNENDTNAIAVNGVNLLARWNHVCSNLSEISLQVYYDHTFRDYPGSFVRDILNTFDIDFQHNIKAGKVHHFVWGAGYRLIDDNTKSQPPRVFDPERRQFNLYNTFVQDQISIIPNYLSLTLGTKLLHNDYTHFEFQPSVRLAWNIKPDYTLWAAVSHVVRTPGRYETDEITPSLTTPGGKFDSEKLLAYELGYRFRPLNKLSVSLATYYNFYTDLRSIDLNPNPPTKYIFANHQKAESWGVELSGNIFLLNSWRLKGGYTYLNKKFSATSPNVVKGSDLFEGLDPQHQFSFQSIVDLPYHFQWDVTGRYIDILPQLGSVPFVPSYFTIDMRFAWEYEHYIISLIGQNLAQDGHAEFSSQEIPRSVYLKIAVRF